MPNSPKRKDLCPQVMLQTYLHLVSPCNWADGFTIRYRACIFSTPTGWFWKKHLARGLHEITVLQITLWKRHHDKQFLQCPYSEVIREKCEIALHNTDASKPSLLLIQTESQDHVIIFQTLLCNAAVQMFVWKEQRSFCLMHFFHLIYDFKQYCCDLY